MNKLKAFASLMQGKHGKVVKSPEESCAFVITCLEVMVGKLCRDVSETISKIGNESETDAILQIQSSTLPKQVAFLQKKTVNNIWHAILKCMELMDPVLTDDLCQLLSSANQVAIKTAFQNTPAHYQNLLGALICSVEIILDLDVGFAETVLRPITKILLWPFQASSEKAKDGMLSLLCQSQDLFPYYFSFSRKLSTIATQRTADSWDVLLRATFKMHSSTSLEPVPTAPAKELLSVVASPAQSSAPRIIGDESKGSDLASNIESVTQPTVRASATLGSVEMSKKSSTVVRKRNWEDDYEEEDNDDAKSQDSRDQAYVISAKEVKKMSTDKITEEQIRKYQSDSDEHSEDEEVLLEDLQEVFLKSRLFRKPDDELDDDDVADIRSLARYLRWSIAAPDLSDRLLSLQNKGYVTFEIACLPIASHHVNLGKLHGQISWKALLVAAKHFLVSSNGSVRDSELYDDRHTLPSKAPNDISGTRVVSDVNTSLQSIPSMSDGERESAADSPPPKAASRAAVGSVAVSRGAEVGITRFSANIAKTSVATSLDDAVNISDVGSPSGGVEQFEHNDWDDEDENPPEPVPKLPTKPVVQGHKSVLESVEDFDEFETQLDNHWSSVSQRGSTSMARDNNSSSSTWQQAKVESRPTRGMFSMTAINTSQESNEFGDEQSETAGTPLLKPNMVDSPVVHRNRQQILYEHSTSESNQTLSVQGTTSVFDEMDRNARAEGMQKSGSMENLLQTVELETKPNQQENKPPIPTVASSGTRNSRPGIQNSLSDRVRMPMGLVNRSTHDQPASPRETVATDNDSQSDSISTRNMGIDDVEQEPAVKGKSSMLRRLSKGVMNVVRSRSASPAGRQKTTVDAENNSKSGSPNSGGDENVKKSKSGWGSFKRSIAGSMGIAFKGKEKAGDARSLSTDSTTSPVSMQQNLIGSAVSQHDDVELALASVPIDNQQVKDSSLNSSGGVTVEGVVVPVIKQSTETKPIMAQANVAPVDNVAKHGVGESKLDREDTSERHSQLGSRDLDRVAYSAVGEADVSTPSSPDHCSVAQDSSRPRMVRQSSDMLVSEILTDFVQQADQEHSKPSGPIQESLTTEKDVTPTNAAISGKKDLLHEVKPRQHRNGAGLADRLRTSLAQPEPSVPSWVARLEQQQQQQPKLSSDVSYSKNVASSIEGRMQSIDPVKVDVRKEFEMAMERLRSRREYNFAPYRSGYNATKPINGLIKQEVVRQSVGSKSLFGDKEASGSIDVRNSLIRESAINQWGEQAAAMLRHEEEQLRYSKGSWKYYADRIVPLASTIAAREKRFSEIVSHVVQKLPIRQVSFRHNESLTPLPVSQIMTCSGLSGTVDHENGLDEVSDNTDPNAFQLSAVVDHQATDLAKSIRIVMHRNVHQSMSSSQSSRVVGPPAWTPTAFGGMPVPALYGPSLPLRDLSAFEIYAGVAFWSQIERKTETSGLMAKRVLFLYGCDKEYWKTASPSYNVSGRPVLPALCVYSAVVQTTWGWIPYGIRTTIPLCNIESVTMDANSAKHHYKFTVTFQAPVYPFDSAGRPRIDNGQIRWKQENMVIATRNSDVRAQWVHWLQIAI